MNNYKKISQDIRKARLDKNLDLNDISRKLKIRKKYLIAIEDSELDAIPGEAFIIGYIKMYAKFLSVDVNLKQNEENIATYKYKKLNKEFVKKHVDNDLFTYSLYFTISIIFCILLFFSGTTKSTKDQVMEYLISDEYILKK